VVKRNPTASSSATTIGEIAVLLDAARDGRSVAKLVDLAPGLEVKWLAQVSDLQRFACLRSAYQCVKTRAGLGRLVRIQFEWLLDETYDTELGHQRRSAWKRIVSCK